MKTVWNRSFFPILITYFIDNFGLAIVYPIFARLYLEKHLDFLLGDPTFFLRISLLGITIASFPLAQFFGAPIWGSISDKIGRKRVLLTTISGGILGYLLTGLGIRWKLLPLLLAGRALAGFFAGNLTLCLAAIADISHTQKERTLNFGWIATVGGIGFVLAVLTGGSLSNPDLSRYFSPDIPFFITACFAALNLILMKVFFIEVRGSKTLRKIDPLAGLKNIGKAIRTKGVFLIYGVSFLFMVCWVASMQFLSAYLIDVYHVTANTLTLTFVFIGITWSFANFIINPFLSSIFPSSKTFLLTLSFLGITLFLTLIPHEPLPLFLFHFFLATLFASLAWTNGLATISAIASKALQGSVIGINQSVVAIASILAPIGGAAIFGIDVHKLYLFTGGCSFLAAGLLLIRSFGINKGT